MYLSKNTNGVSSYILCFYWVCDSMFACHSWHGCGEGSEWMERGLELKLHCESAHLGASDHEAMNFPLTPCRTTSSASPAAFIASLPNWPCTFHVIGIMLEAHPGLFLPWLCSLCLFLCFLFFLTHYVAMFPSCVLWVSSLLFLRLHSALGPLLPFILHCLSLPPASLPWSSHPPTSPSVTWGRCRMVVKGIDSGARLPGSISFLSPFVTRGMILAQVVLSFFASVSSSLK